MPFEARPQELRGILRKTFANFTPSSQEKNALEQRQQKMEKQIEALTQHTEELQLQLNKYETGKTHASNSRRSSHR